MTALYEQLQAAGSLAALLGLILSIVGALGALAHGGYDLANAINPPNMPGALDLPFAVDPRGLLTFGMAGLGVDDRGFVRVDESLRSVSHPHIFAVGDCAGLGEAKSGVHAVRHGAVLEQNFRNLVANVPLVNYEPDPRALLLMSCGARYAIAARGAWSAEGPWAWWWKYWIDRRWMKYLRGEAKGELSATASR